MFCDWVNRLISYVTDASDDGKSSAPSPRQEPDSDFLDWLASLLGLRRSQNPERVLTPVPVPVPVRVPRRMRR